MQTCENFEILEADSQDDSDNNENQFEKSIGYILQDCSSDEEDDIL